MRRSDLPNEPLAAVAEQYRAEFVPFVLKNLFSLSADAILAIDAEGRICEANSHAVRLFGYEREELIGLSIDCMVPEHMRSRHSFHRENFNAHPREQQMGLGMDLMGLRKDGTEFPVDVMLRPMQTDSGPIILSFIRDVTAQRAVQDALRSKDLQIRSIVESVRDCAIYMLDRDGNVVTWNAGGEHIKGYSAEEILGLHYSRFFTQEDLDRNHPTELMRLAAERENIEDEGWRVRKDGTHFWANTVLTVIRNPAGEVTGYAKVTRDFTARRLAEIELREAGQATQQLADALELRVAERTRQLEATVQELRDKNREVEAYSRIVTNNLREKEVLLREVYHRVKNNLQVVKSLLKMGARTLPTSEGRNAIETAVQRVQVMAMVHERLYQQKGDLSVLSLSTYLGDVIEGAISANSERAGQIQLELNTEDIPLTLDLAIPFGLLANELVSNCLKHGFPNGRKGKISFSVARIPGAARVIVKDNGVGLPENFDAAKGNSMGLKLAASLAHQLGGKLKFSNGDGCCVQADLAHLAKPREAAKNKQ
jgi:PAS domain S-box-containing protein